MRQQQFQQAARAAFSPEDWTRLMDDAEVFQKFAALQSVQDVEAFVFEAYEQLRQLREDQQQPTPWPPSCGMARV